MEQQRWTDTEERSRLKDAREWLGRARALDLVNTTLGGVCCPAKVEHVAELRRMGADIFPNTCPAGCIPVTIPEMLEALGLERLTALGVQITTGPGRVG